MFKKRSSRGNEPAPRRRRIAEDEFGAGAPVSGGHYRRNQTLSGYRHKTPDDSERQKAHQLAAQRRRVGGVFAVVAVIAILLLFLLWQLIVTVTIATSTKQLSGSFEGAHYESIVQEYLTLNPAQRLRFALDERALSEYVTRYAPEVEAVELSDGFGVAEVSMAITFRTPVAGWQINGQQYFVDASGMVFEENYYSAPSVQIVDESGISPGQGGAVVGTRLLGFLGRVVSEAGERGYKVTRAVLPANTTRQVDIYFKGSRTRVKCSVDRGAGEQMEDADRALQYLKKKRVTPSYIDVRVEGQAAYR